LVTVRDVATRLLCANALQRMMASVDGSVGNIRGANRSDHSALLPQRVLCTYRIDERGESLGLTSPQHALDKLVGDHESGWRTSAS
jgi:hypothetical protein